MTLQIPQNRTNLRRIYYPLGHANIVHDDGSGAANPIRYTGREMDETGLYYYRARYYSPEMGRFISEDPIRFAGEDVNFYAYVGNRPVNRVDPLGLKTTKIRTNWGRFGAGAVMITGGMLSMYAGVALTTLSFREALKGGLGGLPALSHLFGASFLLGAGQELIGRGATEVIEGIAGDIVEVPNNIQSSGCSPY